MKMERDDLEPVEGESIETDAPEETGPESTRDFMESQWDSLADNEDDEPRKDVIKAEEDKAWQQRSKEKGVDPRVQEKALNQQSPQTNQQIAAPVSWNAEEKEAFAKAPPLAQAAIMRHERERIADYTRKTQQVAQLARTYQGIDDAIAPYRDKFARQGIAIPQLIGRFLQWNEFFEKDKHTAARELLASYEIEPEELQDYQPYKPDPEREAIRQELETLRQERTHRQQAEYRQRASAVAQITQGFASERDQNGNPAHPYWEELEHTIAASLPALKQRGLPPQEAVKVAYKMALQAHPEVAQKVEQARQATVNAQRINKDKDTALRARSASRSISGSAPSGTTRSSVPTDRREYIAGLMEGSIPLYGND